MPTTKISLAGKITNIFRAILSGARRWLYIIAIIFVSAYAFWVWDKYITKASWSEEKKQKYIQEQATFTFEKNNYDKAVELMKSRKEKLGSGKGYGGRDIYFPEGF